MVAVAVAETPMSTVNAVVQAAEAHLQVVVVEQIQPA
jgi:hypothetical protein